MSMASVLTRIEDAVLLNHNDLLKRLDDLYGELAKQEAQHQEELAAMRAANNDHREMIRAARVEAYDRGYHDGYSAGFNAGYEVGCNVIA